MVTIRQLFLFTIGTMVCLVEGQPAKKAFNNQASKDLFAYLENRGRDPQEVNNFLQNGADVNYSQGDRNFLILVLQEFCWSPQNKQSCDKVYEITQLLVNKGANVNFKNAYGDTALGIAAYYGNKQVINFLLPLTDSFSKSSALLGAARGGHLEIIKILLPKIENVNVRDGENGPTALHYAAGSNPSGVSNPAIVKLLLNAKADTNIKDHNGYTPLHYASEVGNKETVNLLLKAGAKVE